MPNLAQQAIARSSTFLAKAGPQSEVVSLNKGDKVRANINRNIPSQEIPGSVEVSTLEGSVIEYPLGGTIPKVGDVIVDSLKISHRVKRALHIGHAIKCECEVLRD